MCLDEKTDFTFTVDSGVNNFRIPFNKPIPIIFADPKWVDPEAEFVSDKIQKGGIHKMPQKRELAIYVRDVKSLEATWNYLTGSSTVTMARQTDVYGIVPFDPGDAIVKTFEEKDLIDDLVSDDPVIAGRAKERLIKARLDSAKREREAYLKLRELSEARIRRSLREKHNNLVAQWRSNDERKIGRHSPSLAERLGFKILEKEINARESAAKASIDLGNEMMNRQIVGG